MASSSPATVKKLLEQLQGDLRALSMDCKKKYPPVKEAAEFGIVKIKTISAKNDNILGAIKERSLEVVQPLLLGCGTKEPKVTLLCLTAIQRLLSHEVVNEVAAVSVVTALWQLMENGLEELKLLQTVLVLLTSNTVVHDEALAKAIVLCFRLHFTKDNITNNTAAATVRQVVTVVFERMVAEEEQHTDANTAGSKIPVQTVSGKRGGPASLKPCAKDAYMLFQDLCQLVNADAPFWLVGMTEMTRTFGLELLESVLNTFPQVFLQHAEFAFLLKERVCPLVIKLFSPNIKFRHGSGSQTSPSPGEKPYFPICMRLLRVVSVLIKHFYSLLVTECEIFLSLLVKFLDGDKPQWLRALAVESLHKLCVQPQLLRSFCECYDMKEHSTKVFRDIINALGSFIQSLFLLAGSSASQPSVVPAGTSAAAPGIPTQATGVGPGGPNGGITPQPAFEYRGTWIPILNISAQGSTRAVYLELLDKVEAPPVADGYAMSVAFNCLLDLVRGVTCMIEGEMDRCNGTTVALSAEPSIASSSFSAKEVWEAMIELSWCGLLAALSPLLDASTDEAATESILKAHTSMAAMSGRLSMVTPRDAFITAICKASLPPHYALTAFSTSSSLGTTKVHSTPILLLQPGSPTGECHQQVVAMGQPLSGQVQGTVVLTAKNMQAMRTLLTMAHCHGAVLGAAWHMVLSTLQHLVWILGLKPAPGGSLKPGRAAEGPSTVLTTAVLTDLPVISNMLSRLFESSQYLDDVSLHHLINALCSLSNEAMEMACTNSKEPSLFAVAKLLETGLVNMHRVDVLWRPVTAHLMEVSQHPNTRMREWGAEAVTTLIKDALAFNHSPPLSENQRLQATLLAPLRDLSQTTHTDIRQRQLECVLQLLQSQGERLGPGWPLVLGVIGAIRNDQGESLIRTAFQCLQLVVTDFLSIMPSSCLSVVVKVAGSFGIQNQELNISLTSIGLLWNISDYFSRRRDTVEKALEQEEAAKKEQAMVEGNNNTTAKDVEDKGNGRDEHDEAQPLFDRLWLTLYSRLGKLCVDPRPAVRKSAGQTLFSTIGVHGILLCQHTWQTVLWQVLFPLLDEVRKAATTADKEKIDSGSRNILIHHSRDTAEKQWAETWVLSLAGIARIFNSRRSLLMSLGDYPKAWGVLLEHIQAAALSCNWEVSLAALKSFHEVLQMGLPDGGREYDSSVEVGTLPWQPSISLDLSQQVEYPACPLDDKELWWAAWQAWETIGHESTAAYVRSAATVSRTSSGFIPSQQYLTALVQSFIALFERVRGRFGPNEMRVLGEVLLGAVSVPVSAEASPFLIPLYGDAALSPLQEAVLAALALLEKTISSGQETMQLMYPAIFEQLLQFIEFSCRPTQFGRLENRIITNGKHNQAEWVVMNYVPFAETALRVVVELYQKAACHKAVINAMVLEKIVKTLRLPLGLRYGCPSESTWHLAVSSLLSVLCVGLPVARQHTASARFDSMWPELAGTFRDFLFPTCLPPENMSLQEFQENENIDVQVVQLIGSDILSHAHFLPKEFVNQIMSMLNRGSIHSQSASFTEAEVGYRLREEFSKVCFETLLQFSFGGRATCAAEGYISRMALTALLQRAQQLLAAYVEDERLSGSCPLPRQRITEVVFILKATGTLMESLKKTPAENVDVSTWEQILGLYPSLVACVPCICPEVCLALQQALLPFQDLLTPPPAYLHNGTA
uniref:protein MON2 homolog isoform X2 n=1 Tax=Myxine glutinosa TaxID=7769 RepID=UPI00358F2E5D